MPTATPTAAQTIRTIRAITQSATLDTTETCPLLIIAGFTVPPKFTFSFVPAAEISINTNHF